MSKRLKPLSPSNVIEVRASFNGEPEFIKRGSQWVAVQLARRPWPTDVHRRQCEQGQAKRTFFLLQPEDASALTVYHDHIADVWFRQAY